MENHGSVFEWQFNIDGVTMERRAWYQRGSIGFSDRGDKASLDNIPQPMASFLLGKNTINGYNDLLKVLKSWTGIQNATMSLKLWQIA